MQDAGCMGSAAEDDTFHRRMRSLVALALPTAVAGCSLLVTTSDLAGGAADGGAAGTSSADGQATPEGSTRGPDGGASDTGSGSGGTKELPGLVGAWLFDDGTANDSSGKGHHGIFDGDAHVVDTSDRGKVMAVSGGGSLTVGVLDNDAFPSSGTISVWFQWKTMPKDVECGVFDEWDSTRHHVFVRHANGDLPGGMQVAYQPSSSEYALARDFDVAKGSWAHVVVTWDEAEQQASVFLDGKGLLGDNFPGGGFTPRGQRVAFGLRLDGLIDDVRLFDRVLSESEIKTLP